MLQELAFTGQWRHYQKRVLDKSEAFMADGHLHLVAAPGSGKTTLGIEFIRRFGQPTLILAPTVTIRQQWVDRIVQAFLKDEGEAEHLISQDLKHPKLITVATYQALHSAMNQVVGQSQAEDTETRQRLKHLISKALISLLLSKPSHSEPFVWMSVTTCAMNGGRAWKPFAKPSLT